MHSTSSDGDAASARSGPDQGEQASEYRAFREKLYQAREKIGMEAEAARRKADLPALLRQLILEIEWWTRELKQETFALFEDSEHGRTGRSLSGGGPDGFEILPGYIVAPFLLVPPVEDLLELSLDDRQITSFRSRLSALEHLRLEFVRSVSALAATWDASGQDYNKFAVVDKQRSSLKLAALDFCHYIDTLANLVESRSPRSETAHPRASSPPSLPNGIDPARLYFAAEQMRSIAITLAFDTVLLRMGKDATYDDRDRLNADFRFAERHGYTVAAVARQLKLDPTPLLQILRSDRLWEYPNEEGDSAIFHAAADVAERVATEARLWCAEAGIDLEEWKKQPAAEPTGSAAPDGPADGRRQEETADAESEREAAFGEAGKIPKMPEGEWLTAGLGLLMLLAQAYYKLLEQTVSAEVASLDLDLNQSYLWTVKNIKNLLKNHEGLSDFPIAFEPPFPNLYPTTVRDVDWEDMIAPDAEHFLGTVQEYVHDKGFMPPEEKSRPWIFIELFRPSIMDAIEKAEAYAKRMRGHMQTLIERVERSHKTEHSPGNQSVEPAVSETESTDGTTDDPPPNLVIGKPGEPCIVLGVEKKLTDAQRAIIVALQRAGDEGMKKDEIEAVRSSARRILTDLRKDADWAKVILMPGQTNGRYRLRQ